MIVFGYLLALGIGILLGLLGGGGSILTLPVLVYVLHFEAGVAVPMSLAVVGVTSAFGAWSHHRQGNIRWDAALAFGPAAIAGAFAGARVATFLADRTQLLIFAVLMLGAALSMYFGPTRGRAAPEGGPPAPRSRVAVALLGAAIGFLTGLVGVGGGFMYVPALVLLGGMAMKQAIGTSLVLIIMSCIAGFAGYLGRIDLDWTATGTFTLLAVVGVLSGSRLAGKVPQAALRKGFAAFLLLMGIVVLLRAR